MQLIWSVHVNIVFVSLSGSSDCVLALGFEKMEKGSLMSKVQ